MWLTRFSIQRPIIVAMLFIAMALYGAISYTKLGRSENPNVTYPAAFISASYPGASPTEMEKLVIKPIEEQIDGIPHLDELDATAQEGLATIVVQFALDTDLNAAINDVEARVNTARGYMPADLDPPSVDRDTNDELLTYAITSHALSGPALADLVNDRIVPKIKTFDTVAGVDVYGEPDREIQVEADPLRLLGSGATLTDVFNAIAQNNANLPGGRIDAPTRETSVSVHADVTTARDLERLPIPIFGASLAFGGSFATTSGNNMLLGDLARVVDGHADARQIAHFNAAPAVLIDINRNVTSDEISSTAKVRAAMKTIFAQYPQMTFREVYAPADYTQASLNGVFQSLFEGIALTAIVLMLFLHAWRNAIVVMIAIPSSLLATFCVMQLLHFTLDSISLMALSLIIGILVDDSIVVLENITRHRDMGQTPDEAAISGRTEIGGAAIAITLVDVVVFLPLAFLSGFVGKYFVEFGVVVTVATLFSLFVSFTLTPMLAATWSVKQRSAAPPAYLAWFQGSFEAFTRWYRDRVLAAAFRHRWLVFASCVLLVVNAVALVAGISAMTTIAMFDFIAAASCALWLVAGRYAPRGRVHVRASLSAIAVCAVVGAIVGGLSLAKAYIPFEFLPEEQMGQISGTITYPTGTPLATTAAALARMERAALKVPYVDSVRTTAGRRRAGWSQTRGGFVGQFSVTLQKTHRRDTNATIETLRALFPPLATGSVVTVSERSDGGAIDYTLTGPDAELQVAANTLAAFIRTLKGTTNVQTGSEFNEPRLDITIDPRKCALLGVSPAAAASVMRIAVGGAVATRVRTEAGLVDVRLQYPAAARNSIDELSRVTVRSNDGSMLIPLARVAAFRYDTAPTRIDRQNRERIAEVTADIDHSTSTTLGDISAAIDAKIAQPGFLPSSVTLGANGDSKLFGEFLSSMGLAALGSFALVYMLMVILYGNFGTPFVIMFAIPVALVGAFGALKLFHQTMNVFSVIGLIMLFGLVAKNGILLVDYANTLRRRGGMRAVEAMTTAAGTRLRPIVMTTLAMVFGMFPLALGLAEGGEVRRSMGVVLIGGLTSSLVLTLLLVPIAYTAYMNLLERRADRRALHEERSPAAPRGLSLR